MFAQSAGNSLHVFEVAAQGMFAPCIQEARRPCGISKRGGKVLLLDFSSELHLPPPSSLTNTALEPSPLRFVTYLYKRNGDGPRLNS
jgi:hypothetical protein